MQDPMLARGGERQPGDIAAARGQIPLLARIVQVADIYDALISPRPYKPSLTRAEALREETEQGWRDPEIVRLFFSLHEKVISRIADYTTGSDRNLEAMRGALASLQTVL